MFAPHVKITKPAYPIKSFKHEGYDREIASLLLQDTGFGRMPYLFEFRFTKSACNLYVGSDRNKFASAGGYGYDKKGSAFAQWVCKTFKAELKALFDQPKYQKQLEGSSRGEMPNGKHHPWYCTYRNEKTGEISINGMSGFENVNEILERAFGLTLRYIGETKDSTLYLLAKAERPAKKKTKAKVPA